MPRRSNPRNLEDLRQKLISLFTNFRNELESEDLRAKVLALVPAFHHLRDLGSSLISRQEARSARDRILFYFRKYPFVVIDGDEIMVVAGINDWPRRVRELRVEYGWSILSGVTAKRIATEEELPFEEIDFARMKPDQYILVDEEQDRDAAYRWNLANDIRRKKLSVQDKILEFMRANVGKRITGEELQYLAKGVLEWPRRVRELRTEERWPIVTKVTGRPDLPVGVYMLEEDRQLPAHDRHIPDPVRGAVLRRDDYHCQNCDWSQSLWNPSDPRHLELHHREHHVRGGSNEPENLITLCNVCHDDVHRRER
jgi:hypothetical protein